MTNTDHDRDDLRSEYDFEHLPGGVRGKHAERYHAGTSAVLLAPDVAAAFPTSESVNDALRVFPNIAESSRKRSTGRRNVA